MNKILIAALGGWSLLAVYPAYAAPTFCTGTITTVTSGQNLPGSFFLTGAGASTGNCAEAADKFIGGFSATGAVTGAGSSVFDFTMPTGPANVQLGIQGSIGPSTTGTIDYSVAVDPLLSNGALIDDLGKDFTLGAANVTGAATATLTGTSTATTFMWDCVRTVNPSTSTCPQEAVFPVVASMTVHETVTTGANAVVTGLTDTISQSVSEPGTLAILGSGLGFLGLIGWRRSQRNSQDHFTGLPA